MTCRRLKHQLHMALLTILLILVWQMLVNKVTLGNLVLGAILGLIIPLQRLLRFMPSGFGVGSER